MAYPAQFIIPNGAAVNQTFNRTGIEKGVATYVNDTARAAGKVEWFKLRATNDMARKSIANPTTTALAGKWNMQVYTADSTDIIPQVTNFSFEIANSLSNVVASARNRAKDHRSYFINVTNTDALMDDLTAFRTM